MALGFLRPELDLVYWGTGNAEPYDPHPRGGLDSLYTSSVIAIRPKTGEIACFYQFTPNDVYDVDGTDEMVLADIQVGGRPRKVMIQANKNGFLYVIDRSNCQLIAANPMVKVNWASSIDIESGRPVLTDVYKRFFAGEEVEIWPSRGTNAVPIAFDPASSLVYASTWDIPRIQKIAAPKPQVLGADSTGVTARVPDRKPGEVVGHFIAMNPLTRREEVGCAAHGSAEFGGDARHRRRTGVHRKADGRVPRARRRDGKGALAVPDRFERQRHCDHLHTRRPAICEHRLRTRRYAGQSLRGGDDSRGWFGVDIRADALAKRRE
jgi:alcohol dehydrogenase (cytochrome c)